VASLGLQLMRVAGRPSTLTLRRVLQTAAYTVLALLAFAANSLLCRLALTSGSIDPASFTAIRLATGAAVLLVLVRMRADRSRSATPSWVSAALLALYAVPFSFAYRKLTAGTGALILFAAVQLTMILGGIRGGRWPTPSQWLGLVIAFTGLTYLVLPGLAAPSPQATTLMLLAGMAWGLYSLRGRTRTDPLAQTAGNFTRAIPWALGLSLVALPHLTVDARGVWLASLSGALASGLGYVLWYRALPHLSPALASLVQLTVPPLAAVGGLAFVGEPLTSRLILASAIILGGIAIALWPGAARAAT
jgi:drug/metabolite transporter (DMT)-like permease